jgi:ERCC4-type nuclease
MVLVDTREITNSIDESKMAKNPKVLMPLLLDPEFIGREKNEQTGKSYQKFKLKNFETLGIEYSVETLVFVDYIVETVDANDDPLVDIWERKTVTDLIGSMTAVQGKGKIRIDDEIGKCMKGGELYYGDGYRVSLVIEDFYECRFDFSEEGLGVWVPYRINYSSKKVDSKNRPVYSNAWYSKRLIHPAALLAKIASFEKMGVNIIRCGGAHHAYKLLIDEITGVKKKKSSLRAIRLKPTEMNMTTSQLMEFFLQGLPGIGGVTARDLLAKEPVPIKLLNAIASASDPADIGVKGYGPITLDANKNILNGTWTLEKKEG